MSKSSKRRNVKANKSQNKKKPKLHKKLTVKRKSTKKNKRKSVKRKTKSKKWIGKGGELEDIQVQTYTNNNNNGLYIKGNLIFLKISQTSKGHNFVKKYNLQLNNTSRIDENYVVMEDYNFSGGEKEYYAIKKYRGKNIHIMNKIYKDTSIVESKLLRGGPIFFVITDLEENTTPTSTNTIIKLTKITEAQKKNIEALQTN